MALAFLALAAGAVLIIAGVENAKLAEAAQGRAKRPHAPAFPSATSLVGGLSSGGAVGASLAGEAASGGVSGGPALAPGVAGRVDVSLMKATVRALAKAHGWSASDWEAVIERESGWNPNATNGETGAYGIGQFNPSTEHAHGSREHPVAGSTFAEYASAGAASSDWRSQLVAMALYIRRTYGSPTNALAHENSAGWY